MSSNLKQDYSTLEKKCVTKTNEWGVGRSVLTLLLELKLRAKSRRIRTDNNDSSE